MKKTILLLLALYAFNVQAQKVDIDNHHFEVEYAVMPENHVDEELRTFSVKVEGDSRFDLDLASEQVLINGWERVENDGTAQLIVNVKDFKGGRSQSKSEVKKDRNGKRTGTDYWVEKTDQGIAIMEVYGPVNKYEEPKKKKKKKKKKKGKKEKTKKDNPFLANVDLTAGGGATGDLAKTFDISKGYTYTTGRKNRSSRAAEEYKMNADVSYDNAFNKFHDNVGSYAAYAANKFYGYNSTKERAKFKRLDSDDHPEYEMFENGLQAMRAILEAKKYDQDIEVSRTALAPIIAYLIEVKGKYKKDDKHHKRLKAAAMYNLAQMYYFLDMPDEMIAIGEEYIRWDHDKKDGEKFVERGEKLKHLLSFHKANGRYFIID